MRTIQDELGDGADAEHRGDAREGQARRTGPRRWPKLFEKELQKLERLNPAVAEYSVQVTYLQLLLELPWNDCDEGQSRPETARASSSTTTISGSTR